MITISKKTHCKAQRKMEYHEQQYLKYHFIVHNYYPVKRRSFWQKLSWKISK